MIIIHRRMSGSLFLSAVFSVLMAASAAVWKCLEMGAVSRPEKSRVLGARTPSDPCRRALEQGAFAPPDGLQDQTFDFNQ